MAIGIYSAQKREGEKDFLTRIGSGWSFSTKDGRSGLNVQLSALPLGDRMVIFEGDDEEAEDKTAGGRSSGPESPARRVGLVLLITSRLLYRVGLQQKDWGR